MALSGGGMKGIAMLGAMVEFQKQGWLGGVRRYAGTSIGAIIAAVLALDRDLERVFADHVHQFRYSSTYDIGGLDKTFGLDTGEGLKGWIDAVLREPITFKEVKHRHGSTLLVCASNLNTRSPVIFGPETHPDMDVATALRMSCSIPLYFAATTYRHELYVDGALTQNFPVAAASQSGRYRVLGVKLVGSHKPVGYTWSLDSFLGALVDCTLDRPLPPEIAKKAVVFDLNAGPGTQPVNFRMPPDAMKRVFVSGKTQAREFMSIYSKKNV